MGSYDLVGFTRKSTPTTLRTICGRNVKYQAVNRTHSKRRTGRSASEFFSWCRDNAAQSACTTCAPFTFRTRRRGQLGRPRDDHWRRSPGLFQRHRTADGSLRSLSLDPPRVARQGDLSANHSSKAARKFHEYADMERQIDETAGRVNGTYGEASWTPIRQAANALQADPPWRASIVPLALHLSLRCVMG